MDLYDTAIQMEIKGALFYRDLAGKAVTKGLKALFRMLAEDEHKHQQVFMAMRDGLDPQMADSIASDEVENVFKDDDKADFLKESKQVDVYGQALELELESIEFYSEKLEEIELPGQLRILERIIQEERSHYDIIDDIIIMVSRPDSWVENAEFGIRENY
ncbi:MAG: ferritin family protein [Sphaerochaetaceae bacterium]